eukprot:scaffold66210_cov73-Phaeocystis_antarctica.AAC.1
MVAAAVVGRATRAVAGVRVARRAAQGSRGSRRMGKRSHCSPPPPQGLTRTARQTAPREPGRRTRLRTGATPARARTPLSRSPPPPPPPPP